jgi:ABC-2 type transport system permease protein
MAETHLEVYRRFTGELRRHPLRFWPIFASGVRAALKQKLALVLFMPPLIATIFFSIAVQAKFAFEQQLRPEGMDLKALVRQVVALARPELRVLEVANMISQFNIMMAWFALLATAWYGSGLFCEDRRVGAHQLYFSRPITRLDYFLGKFLVVAFFASFTMLVPGMVICVVATLASPEWSFLKQQWDVIPRTFAVTGLWIVLTSSVTLAVSSLTRRKAFTLIGCFFVLLVLELLGGLLGEVVDPRLRAFSPIVSYFNVASWIFALPDLDAPKVELAHAWLTILTLTGLALSVIALRLRRLEVVA